MTIDVKPYCLIISFIILMASPQKIILSDFFINMLFVVMFSIIFFLLQIAYKLLWGEGAQDLYLAFRKVMNYLSLFITALAGFNIFLSQGYINETIIKKIILLWTLAGLIEWYYPELMDIVTPGARTTAGRGVTGFAMEPSFYGYMAFFFITMAIDFAEDKIIYIIICLFQIFILAKSSVAILYLVVLAATYIMFNMSFIEKAICFALLFMAVVTVLDIIRNSDWLMRYRMASLFVRFSNNISGIWNLESIKRIDQSTFERVYSIVRSVSSFIIDIGIPHGFFYGGRIESGYGTSLYELGFAGLFMLYAITKRFILNLRLFVAISLSVVMFSAVQMTLPTFAFMVAIAEYKNVKTQTCILEKSAYNLSSRLRPCRRWSLKG